MKTQTCFDLWGSFKEQSVVFRFVRKIREVNLKVKLRAVRAARAAMAMAGVGILWHRNNNEAFTLL
jgi:hypothetical protein